MKRNENREIYLTATIFVLIAIVLYQSSTVASFMQSGKRFTYEDGVYLYEVCSKKGGPKDKLIDRIYEKNNTDFREFILGK